MASRSSTASLLAAVLALGAPAGPANARVAFTGYGNFLLTADSAILLRGPAAILGTTPQGTLYSRAFSVDSMGLFASTKVGEDAAFLVDFTYRSIGVRIGETRIQYAYLDTPLAAGFRLEAGKVTLPFGYYNTRRFYAFQREPLSAPVFISGILGLPIADVGAVVSRRFGQEDLALDVKVYAVNGYGSVSTSTSSLRSPTVPGGLALSNNLGTTNNNTDLAMGGQVALSRSGVGELGASYYRGYWDRDAINLLQMAAGHLHLTPGKLDLLGEYLYVQAENDKGFANAVGGPDWNTKGGLVEASHPLGDLGGKPVAAFARCEEYITAKKGGGGAREKLGAIGGGLSLRANENLHWKAEYTWLDYSLPIVNSTALRLEGYIVRLGLVVTF